MCDVRGAPENDVKRLTTLKIGRRHSSHVLHLKINLGGRLLFFYTEIVHV